MVSPHPLQPLSDVEPGRISFSSEFLDESNFISICPNPQAEREAERARIARNADFEFLSGNVLTNMMSADELFREGKLLPFCQTHHADKLDRINPKSESNDTVPADKIEDTRINWFIDDDPSPRPPKCTLLWKELLKLKKQRHPLTLSPSTSSSSSSSSSRASSVDERESSRNKDRDKTVKRMKKGQEKTAKSTSIRIRPVLNVPICTQAKNNVLPPLFSLRKGRLDLVK